MDIYNNKADLHNLSDLRATADIIEEVSDTVTYLGFCKPGTVNTSEAAFSILKIEQSGSTQPIVTSFKWANGICFYNLVWDSRAAYDYYFRKF